jgi:hypothetical protein
MTTSNPAVSLASLMAPSKVVTLDFPGFVDFTVDLCFLPRDEMVKLRKKCITTKFNSKSRAPEETLNEDLFLSEYCKAIVKNWTGLKFKYLEQLMLVDVAQFDPEDELPYTQDNAELLMKQSPIFDSWVTEASSDLENFSGNKSRV